MRGYLCPAWHLFTDSLSQDRSSYATAFQFVRVNWNLRLLDCDGLLQWLEDVFDDIFVDDLLAESGQLLHRRDV